MIEELVELKLTCDTCKRFTVVKTLRNNYNAENIDFNRVKNFLPEGWTARHGFMDIGISCGFCSSQKSAEPAKG